jgi:hypothetical protein
MTPLGRTLQPRFRALYAWTLDHLSKIERAQQHFDRGNGAVAAAEPHTSDQPNGV